MIEKYVIAVLGQKKILFGWGNMPKKNQGR